MNSVENAIPFQYAGVAFPCLSSASAETGWQDLNSLNLYISWARRQALMICRNLWYASCDQNWANYWSHSVSDGWAQEIRSLSSYQQLTPHAVHLVSSLDDSTLTIFQGGAAATSALASAFIVRLIGFTSWSLDFVCAVKAGLLRFSSKIYRLRNKISLERRFYLTHGAHPMESLDCLKRQLSHESEGTPSILL